MSKRLLLYYFTAVAVTVGWFLFAYRPLDARLTATSSTADELQQRLREYEATARELPALLERQKELQASKYVLESKLYAKADILSLLGDVRSIAGKSGLSVYDITPSMEELLQLNEKARSSSDPLFLNLAVTVDGRFIDFGHYISALESEAFFRGVTRCTVHGGRKAGDKIRCTIAFKALLGNTEAPA